MQTKGCFPLRDKSMKIGWLIPGVGMFGSVREVFEISNFLARAGHDVTVFHPGGLPCTWLPNVVKTADVSLAGDSAFDFMILVSTWVDPFRAALLNSQARVKSICLMGMTENPAAGLAGLRNKISGLYILADSWYQIDLALEAGLSDVGVPIGGVNLDMFRHYRVPRLSDRLQIRWSGDPRERKGGAAVMAALDVIAERFPEVDVDCYFGKPEGRGEALVDFLNGGDIFIEGTYYAGWNNPVVEAMACGLAVICTDIPAVRGLAVHNQTALLVTPGDIDKMIEALTSLILYDQVRVRLARAGFKRVRQFSYEIIGAQFEAELRRRLESDSNDY